MLRGIALGDRGSRIDKARDNLHTSSLAEFRKTFLPGFCWGFLGLALVRLWLQYHVYSLYFSIDANELSIASNLFRGVLILLITVVLIRAGLSPRGGRIFRWSSFILMTLSGIFFFLQAQLALPDSLLGTVGAYLGAVGIIWGGGMWIPLFVRMRAGEAFLYLTLNLGLGSVLGFLFGFLPSEVTTIVLLFVPALIFLGYAQAEHALNVREDDKAQDNLRDTVYDKEPRGTFVILLCGMTLFVFTLGIAQGFPSGGEVSFSLELRATHQLSIVGGCLILIVWVLIKGKSLSFRFIWALETVLAICSLAFYIASEVLPIAYGATLAVVPTTFWLGLSFLIAYDISRHTSLPSYVVLGIIYGVYMTAHMLGRLTSLLFGVLFEQSLIALSFMVFLLALSMILVLGPSFPKVRPLFFDLVSVKSEGRGKEFLQLRLFEGSTKENAAIIEAAVIGMAGSKDLTDREKEIAIFLAKGRTRKYISKELFLSENTVRNHIRNIYTKLDVHSKQEFIDKLENTTAS